MLRFERKLLSIGLFSIKETAQAIPTRGFFCVSSSWCLLLFKRENLHRLFREALTMAHYKLRSDCVSTYTMAFRVFRCVRDTTIYFFLLPLCVCYRPVFIADTHTQATLCKSFVLFFRLRVPWPPLSRVLFSSDETSSALVHGLGIYKVGRIWRLGVLSLIGWYTDKIVGKTVDTTRVSRFNIQNRRL